MTERVRYEDLAAERIAMAERAARLGLQPGAARGRARDPEKAALLRIAGVPERMIGPVGRRHLFTGK